MSEKKKQDYYIGLDIGTNSVGWAATDERYNLIKAPIKGKYKNHDMWGIRLFEEGKTAVDRRTARANRRRLARRVSRIKMLQEIFAEEMAKVDETFFIRLNESFKFKNKEDIDKSIRDFRYPLFDKANCDFTDKEYYDKYPTIYHLRKELINSKEPHDIRLVYLALHHIIKYRGHFLQEGTIENVKDFSKTFCEMIKSFNDIGIKLTSTNEDEKKIKAILMDEKKANSVKAREIKSLLSIEVNPDDNEYDSKAIKNIITEIAKLMAGLQGDISKIFDGIPGDYECSKIKFVGSKYEDEQKDTIGADYPDEAGCIDKIKLIYDWAILTDILGEHDYLSEAMVKKYESHKENLNALKTLFKKYLKEDEYRRYFHIAKDKNDISYCSYIGKNRRGDIAKCTDEDFYSDLKKKLEKIRETAESADINTIDGMIVAAENRSLLPVQRSKSNSTIPHQVHELELKKILENSSSYLPFLKENDKEYGITAIDKIVGGNGNMGIFDYKIPYYVGPLSTRHQKNDSKRSVGANVWIERQGGKENVKIMPWNFNEVVDRERSNEQFIKRMTNKCTYLIGEDVLPKNSLLYKKYMVLNELNNLKIRNVRVDVETKQRIYKDLFEKQKKVTGKQLLNYLREYDGELTREDLSGFDQDFNTNLSSFIDFKKIFGEDIYKDETTELIEDIIVWKTIYGDDKKMIRNVIIKSYPNLSEEILKEIDKLPKYSGWGNFSKKFLAEILCVNTETGELVSIIDSLWNTSKNLMELLYEFGFQEKVDEINLGAREATKFSYDSLVADLYVSPSIKRGVWQTLLIVKEIEKIMGCPPKKIFVEMARGKEDSGRTKTRKQALLDLYKECEKDVRDYWTEEIEKHDNRELNSKRLYLYYLQMGKCAYSGEPIDRGLLMSGSKNWDIDHIYPQSKIKDDSFDNMVLAKRTYNNEKSDKLVPADWQKKMYSIWKSWKDMKLMSAAKFERLTRKEEFTPEEKAGFIARQLVETRQSTKVVADLLKQIFDTEKTKIVYVKAALASQFRQNPLNVKKSRLINDFHHAKDAYLNIVVGNAYNCKYTDKPIKWMRENENEKYNIAKTMYYDIFDRNGNLVWKGVEWQDKKAKKDAEGEITGGDLPRIREIVQKDTCMYTEYTYCDSGELFNLTKQKKGSKGITVPLKKELDPSKYGGYTSCNPSYFVLFKFEKKGKINKKLIGIPIHIANEILARKINIEDYLAQECNCYNPEIIKDRIKMGQLLILNEYPVRLKGYDSKGNFTLWSNMQLKSNRKIYETIRKIEKIHDKKKSMMISNVSKKYDDISDEQLNEVYEFILKKLNKKPYCVRPKVENFKNNMSEFKSYFQEKLDLDEKIEFIYDAVSFLGRDNKGGIKLKKWQPKEENSCCSDVKFSDEEGRMRQTVDVMKNDVVFVNQSVTGLFENRTKI